MPYPLSAARGRGSFSRAAYLLLDNFVGTGGTNLPSHAPDIGGAWTNSLGTWQLDGSGRAKMQTGDAAYFNVAQVNVGQADGTLTTSMLTATNRVWAGLCFNFQDANNFWLFYGKNGTGWRLEKRIAGTFTTIATAGSVSLNTNYVLAVTTLGDAVTCKVDGATQINQNIGSRQLKTATRHGLFRKVDLDLAINDDGGAPGSTFDYINFLL